MTVKQAAALMECGLTTIYSLVRAGRLPHRREGRRGGRIVLREKDVRALIGASRRGAVPAERERTR